jgi:hypothetical protein
MVKDPKVKGALDGVRTATQNLHKALSDAATKQGGIAKAELEAIPQMAQAAAGSLKTSMGSQNDAVKKQLAQAVTHLEDTQKHAAAGMKTSGQALMTSVKQALASARAASQKVSEAVAATRSAEAKQ